MHKVQSTSGADLFNGMAFNVRTAVDSAGFATFYLPMLATDLDAALQTLGHVVHLAGVAPVQILGPKDPSFATPNTYSGNYGMGVFPLHTDLAHWYRPPRYLVLACLEGTESVGTLVYDSASIVEKEGHVLLYRALMRPRRPIGLQRPLLRLLERDGGGSDRFRFDSLFLQPANDSGSTAYEAVRQQLRASKPQRVILGRPGDAIVIDNWRMLHGRDAVPDSGRNRRIARMYLGELT
jgi:hypothetical protein